MKTLIQGGTIVTATEKYVGDVLIDGETVHSIGTNLDAEVDRTIDADGVVNVLDRLAIERGAAPAFVRFDNGGEFIAAAVADWCRFNSTSTIFIDPGSPWQNAWIESFNGRFRDEFLNGRHFDNLLEARVLIEDWRIDYNINRPHTAHGDLTPTEFATNWTTTNQPQAA